MPRTLIVVYIIKHIFLNLKITDPHFKGHNPHHCRSKQIELSPRQVNLFKELLFLID